MKGIVHRSCTTPEYHQRDATGPPDGTTAWTGSAVRGVILLHSPDTRGGLRARSATRINHVSLSNWRTPRPGAPESVTEVLHESFRSVGSGTGRGCGVRHRYGGGAVCAGSRQDYRSVYARPDVRQQVISV